MKAAQWKVNSVEDIVRRGNAVPPPFAEALVRANPLPQSQIFRMYSQSTDGNNRRARGMSEALTAIFAVVIVVIGVVAAIGMIAAVVYSVLKIFRFSSGEVYDDAEGATDENQ